MDSFRLVGALHCLGMLMMSVAAAAAIRPCRQATMFMFGDSKSDTGNGVLTGNPFFTRTTRRPYGETYPGSPFERFCDGRLRIDYLTNHLSLSFLNPSLNDNANFTLGVNYAVSGATALSTAELSKYGIVPLTPYSLEPQLHWHLHFKANVESSNGSIPGRPSLSSIETGLYVIEIGGNDYTNAFQNYKPSDVISTFIPMVIQKIRSVTVALYNNGARNFLLFGVPAFGCTSSVLAAHKEGTKDEDGCLTDYNLVAFTHGVKLLAEVENLRTAIPLATFTFVDFYGAFIYVLENKASFGFVNILDACCGAAGLPYNYNLLLFCNERATSLCPNPSNYINWDGIHYTDAFNLQIFKQTIITGSFLNPSNGLSTYCSR